MNEEFEHELDDDLGPEYDFANMTGGIRGKYVNRIFDRDCGISIQLSVENVVLLIKGFI